MTTETNTNRDRIRARIHALMQMTTENGASEQEAMTALEKAQKLMNEYNLSATDIHEVRQDVYGAMRRPYSNGQHRSRMHEMTRLAVTVAVLSHCECWQSGNDIVFFGAKHDAQMAHYLLGVLILAADSEWLRYQTRVRNGAANGSTDLRGRAEFMAGMRMRVYQRMLAMIAERDRATRDATATATATAPQSATSAGAGTSLVIVKAQVVAEKFAAYKEQTGMKLGVARSSRRSYRRGENYQAGSAAGDRVNFNSTGIAGNGGARHAIGNR